VSPSVGVDPPGGHAGVGWIGVKQPGVERGHASPAGSGCRGKPSRRRATSWRHAGCRRLRPARTVRRPYAGLAPCAGDRASS
jgi:hypothetical protein